MHSNKKRICLYIQEFLMPQGIYNFTVSILFEAAEGKILLTMKSVFRSKPIIEELNRRVNAIKSGKQISNRLENYIKILEGNKP